MADGSSEKLDTPAILNRKRKPLDGVDIDDAFKKNIKDLLLDLNQHAVRECSERMDIGAKLKKIREQLDLADKAHPNDSDVAALKAMYNDLFMDYEEGRSLALDQGFDEILEQLNTETVKCGLRTEVPEFSVVADVVEKLKLCGVEAAYVVTAGRPNAKTIVYFTQLHTFPGLTPEELIEKGITRSQNLVYNGLVNGINSGLFKHVYVEGPGEQDVDIVENDTDPEDFAIMGDLRAQLAVGYKAKFHGMEDNALHGLFWDFVTSDFPSNDEIYDENGRNGKAKAMALLKYRANAINFLLAWNIASDFLSKDGDVAAMDLGHGHEYYNPDNRTFIHTCDSFPFSTALALRGVNVIVVDIPKK